MFDERIGIMAVGETHPTEDQIDEIEGTAYLGQSCLKIFNSIDPNHPNRAGVVVVLNKDITNVVGFGIRCPQTRNFSNNPVARNLNS